MSEREQRALAEMVRGSAWRDEWPKRDSESRFVDRFLIWFLVRAVLLAGAHALSLAVAFGVDGLLFGVLLFWPVALPGVLIHAFIMLAMRGRMATRARRVLISATAGLVGFGLTIGVPGLIGGEPDVGLWGLVLALVYGAAMGLIGRLSPPLASPAL